MFITVSVFSCQRDEFENQPNDSAISIQNAKTWYEANNPEKIDLKSGLTGDKKNLKPDWKSAVKSENKKYEVVTVDLLTDRGFGFYI